jgi:hypothetical protein
VMESFFSRLKAECATDVYNSRSEARQHIFEYIEVWKCGLRLRVCCLKY